ncbi:response regulator [Caenimonas sedimenti]|uniref:histidine kinase n=1 Tax=Caenimonas sedimenti TaxID=2596921 RepID=A0A562ZTP2_9BURK|nr:hybrid sensor histidine kinase/response regulator [Caenimonas sedimenti]TWO71645.1 response regulator [Caenimonas sedimenti]
MTPTREDERPDPEDSAHTVASLWALRACEVLCVLMFSTAIPWQRVTTWFGVIAALGVLRWWHVNRPWFRASPKPARQRVYRIYMWVLMTYVGSACWFLYVPANLPIQAVLMSYLLGNATLVAVRLTGDVMRTTIALVLAVLPTSLRFIVEGTLDQHNLLVMMGVGGLLMTVTMVFLSRAQESNVKHQVEQRRRAEAAANAVAAMGLSKSRFFAAVSHDLRQPVHAIGLHLDLLMRRGQAAQDRASRRALDGIHQSWRALDDLLSQVLDLTRMDSGAVQADLRPTELAPLVADLVMQHSAVAEAAGVRVVALVRPAAFAMADALMLARVLSNLLDNAIKFSPAGATVAIVLRGARGQWRLQVRDAGMGIPHVAQERIFEEFVQIDNEARDRRRGLGLGLAIARRFALLMEGDISVRSRPGQGCCMTVSLSRAAPPTPAASIAPAHAGAAVDSGPAELGVPPHEEPWPPSVLPLRDVLLVEDDSLVAAATRQLLRSWGLRVRHVETADDALREGAHARADVAICDARLPHGGSGLDVALALRMRGKKVLLISGETNAVLREAAQFHEVQLLTKPVSGPTLLAALQAL